MASIDNIALLKAAEFNNGKMITNIIKRGADVNTQDEFGRTPLYIAAKKGHRAVVRALTKQRADVNIPETQQHTTPVCVATQEGHLGVVRALVELGSDVNIANIDGTTPVIFAA
jgi:ankyrin repeat protein